ncbi:MAG TPA: DUF2953 domain-containing protein [Chitinivibrionales bacterium]|nr:DUF2953 domain-containing protein [Chitinivibrionales bacterium]
MVVTILAILLTVFVVVSSIILFPPITIACSGSVKESSAAVAEVSGWWLHPKLLRCVFDFRKKAIIVLLLGRFRIFSSDSRKPPEEKEPPEPHPKMEEKKPSVSHEEKPRSIVQEHPHGEKIEEEEGAAEKGKRPFSDKLIPLKKAWVFLGDSSFRYKVLRWLLKLFLSLVGAVSFRIVSARVKAGLFDPALTGKAYGYFTGLRYALITEKSSCKEILFEPVFNDEPFSAEGGVALSSSMARLCLPIVFAVLTFPYLHAFILYRRSKKIKA